MLSASSAVSKNSAFFLAAWAVVLFVAIVASVFLHEDGHGIGAKIDGVHVSTGFNRVGQPDRKPGDPDFRTGTMVGFWGGLLGPMTTWTLALAFTTWVYRFRKPGWAVFAVGALAIANGLARGMPMLSFLIRGLGGQLQMEDEVAWGIWYLSKILRLSGVSALLETEPNLLLSYPALWIPTMFSLAISAICLIFAYRQVFKVWAGVLDRWTIRVVFGLLPVGAWYAAWPLLNALDQSIRINW